MTLNIPWMDKNEQPEYSNDIFPMCFFQLQMLDEQNDNKNDNNDRDKVSDKQIQPQDYWENYGAIK